MKHDMQKPLVLIVDDTPTNIQVLAESLADDYRLQVATSGMAALQVVKKQGPPDLILLDVMMPDMDGYEVCRRLKEDPKSSNVPVIFVTAMSDTADEERGLRVGAVDYIAKPFHLPIVKARLQNHIRLKLMADMLESMVWLDGLTGIPNRRRFDEALKTEWKRAQRAGATLSIIMADVDHFKNYNDQYGHGAGDACLKRVASELVASVTRAADMVARYGGEEFVLLAPETDLDGARVLAEQLRTGIEKLRLPHEYSEVSPWVTLSVGYASIVPGKQGKAAALLHEADNMLYYAKRLGRNRVYGIHDAGPV
jgi:diguanylate cyclase (GGDEF)-like protein